MLSPILRENTISIIIGPKQGTVGMLDNFHGYPRPNILATLEEDGQRCGGRQAPVPSPPASPRAGLPREKVCGPVGRAQSEM